MSSLGDCVDGTVVKTLKLLVVIEIGNDRDGGSICDTLEGLAPKRQRRSELRVVIRYKDGEYGSVLVVGVG